uniref:Inner membrane protein n=1 Tax=Caenorhabditis tropicalis TaxID=1561998 RepID=A0A1I7ULT6_9PELO
MLLHIAKRGHIKRLYGFKIRACVYGYIFAFAFYTSYFLLQLSNSTKWIAVVFNLLAIIVARDCYFTHNDRFMLLVGVEGVVFRLKTVSTDSRFPNCRN